MGSTYHVLVGFSVAKATLESLMSVRPSVRPSVSQLSIAKNSYYCSYRPSSLSTINFSHQSTLVIRRLQSLSTIEPINHQLQSSVDFSHQATLVISRLQSSGDFSHQSTLVIIDHRAYQPSTLVISRLQSSVDFSHQVTLVISRLQSSVNFSHRLQLAPFATFKTFRLVRLRSPSIYDYSSPMWRMFQK